MPRLTGAGRAQVRTRGGRVLLMGPGALLWIRGGRVGVARRRARRPLRVANPVRPLLEDVVEPRPGVPRGSVDEAPRAVPQPRLGEAREVPPPERADARRAVLLEARERRLEREDLDERRGLVDDGRGRDLGASRGLRGAKSRRRRGGATFRGQPSGSTIERKSSLGWCGPSRPGRSVPRAAREPSRPRSTAGTSRSRRGPSIRGSPP